MSLHVNDDDDHNGNKQDLALTFQTDNLNGCFNENVIVNECKISLSFFS